MSAEIAAPPILEMGEWAWNVMLGRKPDFVIGDDYLRRWWIVPRNQWSNVYLHEFRRSDDDRAMHDHPWASRSFLIEGRYIEHTPEGRFLRMAGDVVDRSAEALHRIELFSGETAVSLFVTGPNVRTWGFQCPNGWVPWQDYCATDNPGQIGRGCGEGAP